MLGFGLGTAQIGVGTAPYIIPQQPNKPVLLPFATNKMHPLSQSLLFSFLLGIGGAFIGWGLSHLFPFAIRKYKTIQQRSNQSTVLTGSQQSVSQRRKQNK